MSDFLSREAAGTARAWDVPDVAAAAPKAKPRFSTARELEAIQQAAREEGYAQGLQEGRNAAATTLRQKLAALEHIFSTLHAPLEKLDDEVMRELTQLSATVAMQLIQRELSLQPDMVADCVRRAIERVPMGDDRLRVHVHPEDAALLDELRALEDIDRPWRVIGDATMTRGGCRVETAVSSVNATLEARLGTLLEAALGEGALDVPGAET